MRRTANIPTLLILLLSLLSMLLAGCASWVDKPEIDPNYKAQIAAWHTYAEQAKSHKIFELVGTAKEPVKIIGRFVYYGQFRTQPPPVFTPPPSNTKIIVDGLVRLAPFGLGVYGLWAQHATYADFIHAGYGRPAAGPVTSSSYTMNANANNNAGAGTVEWNFSSKNPTTDNSATAPPVIVPGP